MGNTTTSNAANLGATTDNSAVFAANLQAVNLMQQRVFLDRAQVVEDPGEQKRILEASKEITSLITEAIG